MDDLVQWLRAQLDEDERIAQAATPGPWEWKREDGESWQSKAEGWLDYSGEYLSAPGDRATLFGPGMTPHADAVHIAEHDPARVLREIEAKRILIAEHDREWCPHCMDDPSGCPTRRAWVWPYSHRPGFRDEWRP